MVRLSLTRPLALLLLLAVDVAAARAANACLWASAKLVALRFRLAARIQGLR